MLTICVYTPIWIKVEKMNVQNFDVKIYTNVIDVICVAFQEYQSSTIPDGRATVTEAVDGLIVEAPLKL